MTSQPTPPGAPFRPLAGMRVVEVSYGIAAPYGGRFFAALGADVVKIESRRRPDGLRQGAPGWMPADVPPAARLDGNITFSQMHNSKRSIVLELDTEAGRAAARKLLGTADIFISNLLPDVLKPLGLGPDDVRACKSDIIYVSISTFGDEGSGDMKNYRTWGINLAGFCSFYEITGWPEDPPTVWSLNYTDFTGTIYGIACTLAALIRRRATGDGSTLDIALHEVAATGLGDAVEQALNGEGELTRRGYFDPRYLHQNVYALKGEDRRLAITLRDEADWATVRDALGIAEGTGIESALTEAFAGMADDDAQRALGSVRVPWDIVRNAADQAEDPRLQQGGYWQFLQHRRLGVDFSSAFPITVDGQRLHEHRGFPALGEHTEEILAELGFSGDEIQSLLKCGAARSMAHPEVTYGRRPWMRQVPLPHGLKMPENVR